MSKGEFDPALVTRPKRRLNDPTRAQLNVPNALRLLNKYPYIFGENVESAESVTPALLVPESDGTALLVGKAEDILSPYAHDEVCDRHKTKSFTTVSAYVAKLAAGNAVYYNPDQAYRLSSPPEADQLDGDIFDVRIGGVSSAIDRGARLDFVGITNQFMQVYRAGVANRYSYEEIETGCGIALNGLQSGLPFTLAEIMEYAVGD